MTGEPNNLTDEQEEELDEMLDMTDEEFHERMDELEPKTADLYARTLRARGERLYEEARQLEAQRQQQP